MKVACTVWLGAKGVKASDLSRLLLKEEQTAAYSVEIWKRFRKWGGKQNIILKILQRSIVYAVLIEAEGNN
jgi:hypothetical protein